MRCIPNLLRYTPSFWHVFQQLWTPSYVLWHLWPENYDANPCTHACSTFALWTYSWDCSWPLWLCIMNWVPRGSWDCLFVGPGSFWMSFFLSRLSWHWCLCPLTVSFTPVSIPSTNRRNSDFREKSTFLFLGSLEWWWWFHCGSADFNSRR